MSTSRQLVYKTLEFNKPERIPRQLWCLPWANEHYPDTVSQLQSMFPDDIVMSPPSLLKPVQTTGNAYKVGTYIDEWGCTFQGIHNGIVGEVKTPLIQSWSDMGKLRVPEEFLSVDIDAVNAFCGSTDKFVLSGCYPRPFERLQFLRGTENVMMDLAMQSPEIKSLLDIIHQFFLKEFEIWARSDVNGMVFLDDWGSQQSMLISPQMWRSLFKPLYRDYIEIAKKHNKKCFMHSDGYIKDIIPDLIELGLDALNSQIFCMGVKELGSKFRGQITFWGEIDRQNLLPNATTDEIADAVKLVYNELYANGGVIAQAEFSPGCRPNNILKVFETWNELI
jgi:hypothetical protein